MIRVSFVEEPAGLDSILRELTTANRSSRHPWTECYLGALMIADGLGGIV